jgi:hypothetical protein
MSSNLVPRPTGGQLTLYVADDGNVYAIENPSGRVHRIMTSGTPLAGPPGPQGPPGPPGQDGSAGITEAPVDGTIYGRKDEAWAQVPPGGGGIWEAPTDGQQYGRQNVNWTLIPPAGVPEAPTDGVMYGRQNGAWAQAEGVQNPPNDGNMYVRVYTDWVALPVAEAPSDGNAYARQNAAWSIIRSGATDQPTITSISPTTGQESTQVLITVTGTNFTNTSHVQFMGYVMPSTFNSATELQATLSLGPGSSGTYDIVVVDMASQTNAVQFTVTP